jgi:3-oxoacyl-[acyl-carrier protein] reductase
MFKLTGLNAAITGASRGIGRGIAEAYAKQGANLALIATRQEVIDKVAAEISEKYGVTAKGYALDVSNTDDVAAVFKQIVADFGSLEVLVNNAGIAKDGLLMRMKESDWDSVIDVNLKSIFNTCKAIARQMMKQKGGRIINMASINGIVAQPGQANYAASKAGTIGITKSLAKEFASRGITVNAIAPGFIQTDMTDELTEAQKEVVLTQIPLAQLGKTEDIAAAAVFLASSEARYVTGQILSVDGGMNA